jgi:hypothetical protein
MLSVFTLWSESFYVGGSTAPEASDCPCHQSLSSGVPTSISPQYAGSTIPTTLANSVLGSPMREHSHWQRTAWYGSGSERWKQGQFSQHPIWARLVGLSTNAPCPSAFRGWYNGPQPTPTQQLGTFVSSEQAMTWDHAMNMYGQMKV